MPLDYEELRKIGEAYSKRKGTKHRWSVLRRGICAVMKRNEVDSAELARQLGKSYMQIYQWIEPIREPRAGAALALLAWALTRANEEEKKLLEKAYGN